MSSPGLVGILGGTGPVGRGLARRLAAVGVPVLLGSRDAARAAEAAEGIGASRPGLAGGATNEEVAERCDTVFLAVPFAGAAEVVERYAGRLRDGAVVVDVTVPLRFERGKVEIEMPPEGSAAEHLRARLPQHVRLAAALKTIPAHVLGSDETLDCDAFVCGDSPEATGRVTEILERIDGLRTIDAGGLEAARTLERMTLLAVTINKRYRVKTARFRVVGV